jgi:hypothetical protein
MPLPPARTDALLAASALGLAASALVLGAGSGLAVFAVLPCLLFGAALVAFRRSPDPSMATFVLIAAGFVRILLGPVGLGALLLVPVVARRADPEHAKHLIGAAVGVHLAVFAANQLAVVLGEPFPTLATLSPGEALAGIALFVPFTLLTDGSPPPEAPRGPA